VSCEQSGVEVAALVTKPRGSVRRQQVSDTMQRKGNQGGKKPPGLPEWVSKGPDFNGM
jgi:hypothetical protein